MKKPMKVVTHHGKFHADEVFACMVVKYLFPEALVIRTRDWKTIEKADVVIDVGNQYDKEHFRFDHHQFLTSDDNYGMASAGLVWDTYGGSFLYKLLGSESKPFLTLLKEKVARFIREIDLVDIGMASADRVISISNLVGEMNPRWDEIANPDISFCSAMVWIEDVFIRHVKIIYADIVSDEVLANAVLYEEGQIVVLSKRIPWAGKFTDNPNALFVITPTVANIHQVSAITDLVNNRPISRKVFPPTWKGLRGAALKRVTDEPGAIECNDGQFIVDCASRSAAVNIAVKAVKHK